MDAHELHIQLDPAKRASDDIYEQLRALITSGALKPGDRLPSERAMMAELQRSRPTIREALKRLEQGGYVTSTQGASGAVVQELSLHAAEEPLKDMGITALFNVSTADLRGIGSAPSGNNLYVSSVLHKTYLSLDESGTRAAAATVVEAVGDAPPSEDVKTVTLDRPFLYMIVDTHACVPLFMGTVTSME